jgi:hypothetical protein
MPKVTETQMDVYRFLNKTGQLGRTYSPADLKLLAEYQRHQPFFKKFFAETGVTGEIQRKQAIRAAKEKGGELARRGVAFAVRKLRRER